MKKYFDAIADAFFIPQGDGTVRFAITRPKGAYLVLSEAESAGMKLLWRSLVRYYIYAGHVCVLVSLVEPWLGVVLLAVLWIVGVALSFEIRRWPEGQVGEESGQYDWVYYQLAQRLSRRATILLGILALLLAWSGTHRVGGVLGQNLGLDEAALVSYWLVSVRWACFFFAIALSPRAREHWAKAAKR